MNKTITNCIIVALLLIATAACKKDENPVKEIKLDKTTLNLHIGATANLTVTLSPLNSTSKSVNWSSDNSAVATVSKHTETEGLITAKALGCAIITVTSKDGKHSATCSVNVINPEPEMIKVEGGTFTMGCTDGDCRNDGREEPAHQVTVSTFNIAKYPVTQAQWEAIMGNNPSNFRSNDNLPVEMITHIDIQQFIQKLNALTGKNYRLPTEAEWEYAARGGNRSKGYKFSGSDNADLVAWHAGNSKGTTHPVGEKEPNELGIYDMSGNVWEECSDFYAYYTDHPQINPTGPTEGIYKASRGGCFELKKIPYCRISARAYSLLSNASNIGGFRLVLPATLKKE